MSYTTTSLIDETNIPSYTVLNSVVLPADTLISFNGEKIIAESKILDGAFVFERVGRKPVEITLDFTIRGRDTFGKYIFGQNDFYELWTGIWQVDSIVPIENTFLNKIGISNVVIRSISPMTVRGKIEIPCTIKCNEMFNSVIQQQSLNIPV
jgi:hypothetical protein